ncbi:hypothetical protein HYC85_007978 [Camellia sinensis]|uniref:Uncharacterized protein n=1 Tax=Camellia sinensis TaxID=4442 RepID=A0A7J7HQG6_CAMSI|nr:hypothetical protein HYC85_007978 [Camellia sinensis]
MGSSSEEEKLIQMVRDFIESGGGSAKSNSHPQSDSEEPPQIHHKPTFSTLQDVLMRVTNAETQILEKILIYVRDIEFIDETNNNLKKWIVLRLIRDGFEASLCKTSWPATLGGSSDVMKDSNGEAVRLIVDMDFSEEKLMEIICLVCSAAKQSLRERGLHIPPWRKATYMQSKWLSHNCKKISF